MVIRVFSAAYRWLLMTLLGVEQSNIHQSDASPSLPESLGRRACSFNSQFGSGRWWRQWWCFSSTENESICFHYAMHHSLWTVSDHEKCAVQISQHQRRKKEAGAALPCDKTSGWGRGRWREVTSPGDSYVTNAAAMLLKNLIICSSSVFNKLRPLSSSVFKSLFKSHYLHADIINLYLYVI